MDVSKLAPYAKAVAAFLTGLAAFAAVVASAVADGRLDITEITSIIASLGGWLGGTAAVLSIPNRG